MKIKYNVTLLDIHFAYVACGLEDIVSQDYNIVSLNNTNNCFCYLCP